MTTLKISTPRVFLPLLQPARYKGAWGGRSSGKSHFFAELLIERMIMQPTRAVCIREIQRSMKESVKRLLEDKIESMGLAPLFEVLENEIRVVAGNGKGGHIIFQGMQNHTAQSIKSLEGYDVAWVEEAQTLSAFSLKILRPTIRKEDESGESELWFSWNPSNDDDPVDLLLRGENKIKDAIVVEANYLDNPFCPKSMIKEAEADKLANYDNYLHIWMGHYTLALEGAVYADELRKATEDKRICTVPYTSTKGVVAIFDLGHADFTAIWFLQCIGHEFRLIDYYQNQFKKIQHYMDYMQHLGYMFERIVLPHDAEYESLNAERTTAAVVRRSFPNASVSVLKRLAVTDGIDAARTLFAQCWFDERKCKDGLKALKNYRYDKDPDTGKTSKNPLHDEFSHGADAFRYMAVSVRDNVTKPKADPYRTGNSGRTWMST